MHPVSFHPKPARLNANFTRPSSASLKIFRDAGISIPPWRRSWNSSTSFTLRKMKSAPGNFLPHCWPMSSASLCFCWLRSRRTLPPNCGRCWAKRKTLLRYPWPAYDPALAKEDEITYAVQVNGKLRSHIVVPADTPEDTVRERVLADEKVRAATDGKQVAKVIVVAGKLVNVVVR